MNLSAPAISSPNLSASIPLQRQHAVAFSTPYTMSPTDTLSYQPLSTYLGGNTMLHVEDNDLEDDVATLLSEITLIQFDIKDIPGINDAMGRELYELGYTSVEQIARWGRADVRAVSSTLGVDQQKIEDEWIAGARLILSIR